MNNELTLDEMLHIATDAMTRGQVESAISVLKRCVAAYPDNAQAHFLLGANYAQIGMQERAVEELSQTLTLEPDATLARFQLGLLLTSSGQTDAGLAVWQPLDQLDPAHPLYLFSRGLQSLVADQFDQARAWIEQGLQANQSNEALNRDMWNILQRVIQLQEAQLQGAAAAPAPEAAPEAAQHIGVSVYQGNGPA